MSTLAFVLLGAVAQCAVVWLAYRFGFDNGWLAKWDAESGQ